MTDIRVLADDPHQFNYRDEGPRNSQLWKERYLLYLQDVTAVFDGFKALDVADLGIGHNELRVVVGPNGAGKTTMCDVISGMTQPATGMVFFDGVEITDLTEAEIAQRGVGRKFQIPNVFDSLTVWENMLLALPDPMHGLSAKDLRRRVDYRLHGPAGMLLIRFSHALTEQFRGATAEERDTIEKILQRVRLIDEHDTLARNLSHGQRQWLSISTLIVSNPRLLLVDEPAAGLTDTETALTAELILELNREHTIIVIEHDMDFVRRLNARVTVLNEGLVLAEGSMDEVSENEAVIEAYLGR